VAAKGSLDLAGGVPILRIVYLPKNFTDRYEGRGKAAASVRLIAGGTILNRIDTK